MQHAQKIATCCYCGSRTVLNLAGRTRHELACGRCGAPLRVMKSLRADAPFEARPVERARPYPDPRDERARPDHRRRRKPKPLAARLLDLAEDVFDAFD
jgi:hypothetical protein